MFVAINNFLLFLAVFWIFRVGYSYNVQRIEEDKNVPEIVKIELFPNYDATRVIERLQQRQQNGRSEENFNEDDTNKALQISSAAPTPPTGEEGSLDSWSVVWYIASFGGLIVFFLIVSCSEWCCRRVVRNSQNCNREPTPQTAPVTPDTPPPSYDHFAPPSYESICLGRNSGCEKNEYDIYVVPVHALGTIMEDPVERETHDAPPSYYAASDRDFVPAYPPRNQVT